MKFGRNFLTLFLSERFRNKLVPFESEIDHWERKKWSPLEIR